MEEYAEGNYKLEPTENKFHPWSTNGGDDEYDKMLKLRKLK